MAKVVKRPKLSLFERLYLPTLWNGLKITLRHFFSSKKSGVYEDKNKDNKFKATLNTRRNSGPSPRASAERPI